MIKCLQMICNRCIRDDYNEDRETNSNSLALSSVGLSNLIDCRVVVVTETVAGASCNIDECIAFKIAIVFESNEALFKS